jgi:hypothetical protein
VKKSPTWDITKGKAAYGHVHVHVNDHDPGYVHADAHASAGRQAARKASGKKIIVTLAAGTEGTRILSLVVPAG